MPEVMPRNFWRRQILSPWSTPSRSDSLKMISQKFMNYFLVLYFWGWDIPPEWRTSLWLRGDLGLMLVEIKKEGEVHFWWIKIWCCMNIPSFHLLPGFISVSLSFSFMPFSKGGSFSFCEVRRVRSAQAVQSAGKVIQVTLMCGESG